MADELHRVLSWYMAMGCDEAISEATHDHFKPRDAISRQVANPALRQAVQAPAPHIPQNEAILNARNQARHAHNLEDLCKAAGLFEGCGLKKTAKNLCFADGNPEAELMIIGEAPGRDEDLKGRPFVGRAGQLLDKMLAAININREAGEVYLTNTVFWRPPGNRNPAPQEIEACRPFLERQIELVQPRIVLLLGASAAKTMLHTTSGIMKLRGKWRTLSTAGHFEVRTMASLHPAYLLRNPAAKRQAWHDFLSIQVALEGGE
jgi:DNA polymerase